MLDKIDGIPTHPLIVHFAVVLIPLTLLFLIVALISSKHRLLWFKTATAISLFGAGFSGLATLSGENLGEEDEVKKHAEFGEMARNLAILLFIVCLIGLVISIIKTSNKVVVISLIIALCVSIGATYYVYQAGHSGAKKVWAKEGKEKESEKDIEKFSDSYKDKD